MARWSIPLRAKQSALFPQGLLFGGLSVRHHLPTSAHMRGHLSTIDKEDKNKSTSCEKPSSFHACASGSHKSIHGTPFSWSNVHTWKRAGVNTSWCLLGCSIGEFGTLAFYGMYDVSHIATSSATYYVLLALPLINGLATSIALETKLLVRQGFKPRAAFETAMGMSFISMLIMELAMEATDLAFTGGALTMSPIAMPVMLAAGWLAPLPYNYYKLEKYGKSCH